MEEGMIHITIDRVQLHDDDEVNLTSDDKLLVKVELGDESFDLVRKRTEIDSIHEGRTIELKTPLDNIENELANTPLKVSLYTGNEENIDFVGEASIPFPDNVRNKVCDKDFQRMNFDHDLAIDKKGRVVLNVTLARMNRNSDRCPELRLDKVPNLELDPAGTIEAYKEIKDYIDEKDVFFVVGSARIPVLESIGNVVNSPEDFLKYPLHLNTDHFKSVKGKLVNDFTIVKNACSKLPLEDKKDENQSKICNHAKVCENIFGKIDDVKNEKSPNTSGIDEDSEYEIKRDPNRMATRKKCLISTKKRCHCRPVHFSSDSDDNGPINKASRKISDCYLASQLLRESDGTKKPFPNLPARRCENCCEDLTYQPIGKPCRKCGYKSTGKDVTNAMDIENIAEQWDEDEIKFIQHQGFSKYDHCTCRRGSTVLCIYCAINQMREQKNDPKFHEYVKEADEKARKHVEEMCQQVLSKHVPPVLRDEHGEMIKSPPEDVPKLSKMLEWLKSKCSEATKKKLDCIAQAQMQRLQGGADICGKKASKVKIDVKDNKNKVNTAKRKSTKSKNKAKPGMLKLTKVNAPNDKGSAGIMKTSNEMKRLIKMNFDETGEQSDKECDQFKPDWILDDIRDKKLKATIQKLCQFNPADEWRKKEPKPLSKAEYIKKMMRKFGRKYAYSKSVRPVYASERHRHCLKTEKLVPRKMGWMWNLETTLVQKGWRPGKLKKSIRELMEYFLREFPVDNLPTTKEMRARRKLFQQPPEDLTERPTLQIQKKDGQYLITMNPLKDAKTLETCANPYANTRPIQFRITKSPTEVKRRQVKHCLKEAGFAKCTCGQSISGCTCRTFMEKERLDKTVHYLSNMLQIKSLADIVYLSDTTDSDSQMNLEITPPAGKIKHHLRSRTLETHATQYSEHDFSLKRPVRTVEQIKAEQIQKMSSRKTCPGFHQRWPCCPKVEDGKARKKPSRVSSEVKPKTANGMDESIEKLHPGNRNESLISPQQPEFNFVSKNKPKSVIKGLQTAIGKPEKRARGGADIPPEGKSLNKDHRVPTESNPRTFLNPTLSEEFEPPRISKPVNRWDRFRRRRPVRPPWDNSIFIPPPLKNETSRDQKPVTPCRRTQSSEQNCRAKLIKNVRNQNLYRYGLKQDKACNTETFEEEKKDPAPVGAKKSTYHQYCKRPVSAPAKGTKSKPIAVN